MNPDVHARTVQAYSDNAINGAIGGLERMRWLDTWGEKRLAALKAEKERRTAKRREDGKVTP